MSNQDIFLSQKSFFRTQVTKDIKFRKDNLLKLKSVLKSNEEKLYKAIYSDFGKSEFETYATELSFVYKEIDYLIKNLHKLAKPKRVNTNIVNMPGSSHIYSEPLGCSLIIGAWNYPYLLTLNPLVSAIGAGNTAIVKPSEISHNCMIAMSEIINKNFPADYIYVAEGGVPETTEILTFKFDKIFFTGSPHVGKIVYEAAAKNLTPVTLELGGKSPCFVTKSANLEVAAKRIVWGKFLNAGQTCIAPDYVFVDKEIKEKFISLLMARLDKTDYHDKADYYAKIINDKNFQRIVNLIDKDKVIYGGKYDINLRYIEPTIMDNVIESDAIMQEEIFGPVLPVLSYSNFDDALDYVLNNEKPLAGYLFSDDEKERNEFLNKISFGGGCINDTVMHIVNENLPFGGIGNSGTGHYHGKYGFDAFSHKKSILIKSEHFEPELKYPPYDEKKFKWIKRLM